MRGGMAGGEQHKLEVMKLHENSLVVQETVNI
jgi:hypothetical protein